MNPAVGRELDALLRYARSIEATAPAGRRSGAVDAARCYFGGALTVLAHLGLVSDDEHREWWERLTAQLPECPRAG